MIPYDEMPPQYAVVVEAEQWAERVAEMMPGQVVNDAPHPDALPGRRATHQASTPSPARPTDIPKSLPIGGSTWLAGQWQRFPAWVETKAFCIAHHESWSAGLWRAQNGSSSASGFAQWLTGTWQIETQRSGLGRAYSRAREAPAQVQAAVFAWQVQHGGGLYPWAPDGC